RELWALDAEIRPSLVGRRAGSARCPGQGRRQLRTDRIGERHMRDDAVAEEGSGASPGAIDKLSGNNHLTRSDPLPQAAGRTHRDQILRAERLHTEDIGAKVYLAGQDAMTLAVAREKYDLGVADAAAQKGIGRLAEGRLDVDLLGPLQSGHLIKA